MKNRVLSETYEFFKIKADDKSKYLKITILFICFILAIYFIMNSISPLQKKNEIKRFVFNDTVFVQQFNTQLNDTEFTSLIKEKCYKQALLKLSEDDSIHLVVNLKDSLVCLSIKGVTIHKTKLDYFTIDPILKDLSNMEYVRLFSEPILVESEFATVVKEPVVVRQAPKDTAEAALNAYQPDTLIQNPAFLQLQLDYGIKLIFEQKLNTSFKHHWVKFLFKTRLDLNEILSGFKAVFIFKKQEYKPEINIKLPVNNLRSIYRALPDNTYVVIYYP